MKERKKEKRLVGLSSSFLPFHVKGGKEGGASIEILIFWTKGRKKKKKKRERREICSKCCILVVLGSGGRHGRRDRQKNRED